MLCNHLEGNDFSVPRVMEVDTGNSCYIEKLPVERYTSTRETKKPPENNKSPPLFVNHGLFSDPFENLETNLFN